MKNYKYYDLILGAYVCVLLCANLIGPAKVTTIHVPVIGSVTFLAGVLFFPISYVFGDILTEVYGYARDAACIWAASRALALRLDHGLRGRARCRRRRFWKTRPRGELRQHPAHRAASMIAFWCGEFVNSYVLAKMKI